MLLLREGELLKLLRRSSYMSVKASSSLMHSALDKRRSGSSSMSSALFVRLQQQQDPSNCLS